MGQRTFEERFAARVDRSGECWVWIGARNSYGYGIIWRDNKRYRAHRVAFEMANGIIPGGLVVRHKCDNPPCVNPDHLELGTKADNNRDREERGRGYWSNLTHCVHGHPLSGSNLYHNPGGFRQCRACANTVGRLSKEAKRRAAGAKPQITLEKARAIRDEYARGGITQRALAAKYGVSQPTISATIHGRNGQ